MHVPSSTKCPSRSQKIVESRTIAQIKAGFIEDNNHAIIIYMLLQTTAEHRES